MSDPVFVSNVAGLQISKNFNVAGLAILIYDYAITLEDESRWIWGKPWDATRVIFTTARYLPFVGVAFTAYDALRAPYGAPCPSLSTEENILLVLRTYAFWACDKRVLYGLIAYGMTILAGAIIMNFFPPHALLYHEPVPGVTNLCQLVSDSRNPALVYSFLLAFELVVFILTVYRSFHDDWSQNLRTSLVRTIYRDGVFYMICIMLITIANIIADAASPIQFSDMLDIPQITLHSVLASRIMFNLRKSVKSVQGGGTSQAGVVLHTMSISAIQYHVPLQSGVPEDTALGSSDGTCIESGRSGLDKAEGSV